MAKNKTILLSSLRENPLNPRKITDAKFDKLCQSLSKYPALLTVNKLKVDFSNENIILGGNMRYKALLALGYSEIPVEWVEDCSALTSDEKQALIALDNSSYGEWDYELLQEHFDLEILEIADIELPIDYSQLNIDDFFSEKNEGNKVEKFKIVLEYNEEDYQKINEVLNSKNGSKEKIIFDLLVI